MDVIPVMATKGGVGKSKVCVALARALKARSYKVGLLDVDWVSPNLHIELGVKSTDGLVLASGVGDTIKPVISPEGFPLVSSAFIFPDDQAISIRDDEKVKDIVEVTSPGVVDWGGVDYLIMDTPPTTATFVHAALKIRDLLGVVLVSQPATTSLRDLLRTLSLLRDLKVPLLGLIGNQVYVECSHGERISLYDLSEEDIRGFCLAQGVNYLGSIPHIVPSRGFPSLDGIVDNLLNVKPVILSGDVASGLAYKLLIALARKVKNAKDRRRQAEGD